MYADFSDYQGAYCGTLITTQGQWMPAVPALIWTASHLAA